MVSFERIGETVAANLITIGIVAFLLTRVKLTVSHSHDILTPSIFK